MLLLTGPTGNVGTELVEILLREPPGYPFRLAGRDPGQLRARYGAGAGGGEGINAEANVDAVGLDYDDRTTWPAALDGVRTLFLLFPLPSPRAARARMLPFIDAATKAGVSHIVYVSVPSAEVQWMVPHHTVERHIESKGASHGVTYTFLRSGYFMQNLCRAISTHGVDIADQDEIFIPAGKGLTTFVDSRDVARVAADAIYNPQSHRNQAYVLTGAEALDFYQVAKLFTEEFGRSIRYAEPSMPAFWLRLRRRGVKWDTLLFMSGLYTLTRRGLNEPITDDLPRLLGRPPTELRAFIRDYRWRWESRQWT